MNDKIQQKDINNAAWAACDTFRGAVDPAQYKDYILVMLFVKYISDVWNDHYEEYKKQYGNDDTRIRRKLERERFLLPMIELTEEVDVLDTKEKKTVVIDLEEEKLRDNTTYTINFGEAIQDLTEGNAPKDFRFIFATGPYIDSLSVQGTVRDAFTNELKEDVFVILYDNLEDSVVNKERPYYFAKTDKTGKFRIPNVKQDTFKIFALIDNNFNYLFDAENEQIGFLNQNIITNVPLGGAPCKHAKHAVWDVG